MRIFSRKAERISLAVFHTAEFNVRYQEEGVGNGARNSKVV